MILESEFNLDSGYSQDEIYDCCDRIWSQRLYDNSRFNRFSPPYLFPTELPWLSWPENLIGRQSRVLSIAGSGDNVLFFLHKGSSNVVAIDVSYPACMWNELKCQIIKASSFDEIKLLNATLVSRSNYLSSNLDRIFFKALEHTSNRAKKYWLSVMGNRFVPEQLKKFLRPTDTLFADMTFYMDNPANYHKLKNNLYPYRIYNLPIEWLLKISPPYFFDVIYLSNVGEYLRSELCESAFFALIRDALKALAPGGTICLYETTRKEKISNAYVEFQRNVEIVEFKIRPKKGFTFRHCLVFITS